MNQEQPEKVAYTHEDYNLRSERVKPFMHLQMAVGRREIELHPGMTEEEWLGAYADAYRIFVDGHPAFLDRFEEAAEIRDPKKKSGAVRLLVDEVRQQLSH
jgi:hypothetical protein